MRRFQKISACLDMAGCPNRCKHCWLGCTPNGRLNADDLRFVSEAFRPFAKQLEVVSWYREPDYLPEYKELWVLENELSTQRKVPHWELMSFWRAVRDENYVPWLKSLGMKRCQLTLFGGKETTDYFTGRKGAYDEIIQSIELLLAAEIAPRLQVFINKSNVDKLFEVTELIRALRLKERCATFGTPFTAFVHQGSCDGESERLYDNWVTPSDLDKIPGELVQFSLAYWQTRSLTAIFGQTEQELYKKLSRNAGTKSCVEKRPVFYTDKDFNVYPNITTPAPHWKLGNLKIESAETVLCRYLNSESPAQKALRTVPIGAMVKRCGNPDSLRLFGKGDYCDLILNRYCNESSNV